MRAKSLQSWTIACQAPLSMGFSRQEHWSGLPCPSPGDLLDPGIKPMSLTSPALLLVPPRKPLELPTVWQTLAFLISTVSYNNIFNC